MIEPAALQALQSSTAILTTVATAIGAVGATAAVSFVIPSVIDRLRPFPRQSKIADFLPFERMLPNRRHVACAGRRYLTLIRMNGAEMTLSTFERRADLYMQRKSMLDEAHKQGIAEIRFITIKSRTPIQVKNTHTHPVLHKITERWNAEFTETYSLHHYAMIVVAAGNDDDAAEQLRLCEDFFLQRMPDYGCQVLEEDPSAPEKGPLAVIAQIVSPITRPTPLGANLPGEQISARLTADVIDFRQESRGLVKFSNGRSELFASVIGVRDCGDKTSENAIRDVLSIDADMVIYQVVRPLDTSRQMLELSREKSAAPMMTLSSTAAWEYQAALDQLDGQIADSRATIHDYALNIVAYHADADELAAIENEISAPLAKTGATVIRETITAPAIWFSLFPSTEIWPRKFRMMSRNIAANLPIVKPSTGSARSDWVPTEPIAYFRSVSGEPYGFSFHATDSLTDMPPAHTLVIGPTGGGKTTLMTFLASQLLRVPESRMFFFDRMRGAEIFIHAAGGEYMTFEPENQNSGMNPLLLPDTPDNKAFLRQFVSILTGAEKAYELGEISRLIDIVYGERDQTGQRIIDPLDDEDRTLISQYTTAFGIESANRREIEPWIDRSQYGNYFNSPKDTLDLADNRVFRFDMTTVLNNAKLAAPLIRYILHKIYQRSEIDNAPTSIIIDETAPMLANRDFADWFVKVLLREGRKRRMGVVSMWQNPSALAESGLQDVFLAQCQNIIFLRNPGGDERAKEYASWGLNENELDFILGRTYKNVAYACLNKRIVTGETAIMDPNLSKLGPYLKVFSSSIKDVAAHRKAIDKYGPNSWVEPYIHGEFSN